MKLRKKDRGKFVFVSLWDHATGNQIVYTETVGWIEDITKSTLVLRHWRTPRNHDFTDDDCDDAIVRSTIIDIRELPEP